jgi:hypothetical protein
LKVILKLEKPDFTGYRSWRSQISPAAEVGEAGETGGVRFHRLWWPLLLSDLSLPPFDIRRGVGRQNRK